MSRAPGLPLPVEGPRFRLEPVGGDGTRVSVLRRSDGRPVGRIAIEPLAGTLTVASLCIDEAYRSYGAGSEAGRLLVQGSEAAGFQTLRAWAPADRGLAVYFWFRLGLHPIHGEGPDGGLWLERTLA